MSDKRPLLLMIDDSAALRRQFKWSFEDYEVFVAADAEQGVAEFRRLQPNVVTLDLGLPPDPDTPEYGFQVLKEIMKIDPTVKVIAVTGQSDQANAIKAIGLGAHDFVEKPIDMDLLTTVLQRAFKLSVLESENQRLREQVGTEGVPGLLTNDPGMLRVCQNIERLAPTDATVLLMGESGTGKELLARALHLNSNRRHERFVAINCAAIPENLLESELFGHEKGSFTGASKRTIGKIELANNGTLFLDEIGDLPPPLQSKLLRFLQERIVERVGGREEIEVDVRVVSATHQKLNDQTGNGSFRDDLFYRISEVSVEIPPVRERVGDAVLLAHAFLSRFSEMNSRTRVRFTEDAIAAIDAHPWPGNVRELENCIKRASILAAGSTISASDLELSAAVSQETESSAIGSLKDIRDEAERSAIIRALAAANGNVSGAAQILAVSRPTLYNMMSRYGLR